MNSNMIKRVQQMQRDMKKAEEEIANTEFTITCGPVTCLLYTSPSPRD